MKWQSRRCYNDKIRIKVKINASDGKPKNERSNRNPERNVY